MGNLKECPLCHRMLMGEITPATGDSYIITEVNSVTKQFIPTSGMPVKLMGCANCKNILLYSDSVRFIPD